MTEDRRVNFEGREIEASPTPSERTPNYYPGGRVAGRPVPAGWYSEPWWKPALVAGAWGLGSVLLFDAMFSGMHGVGYGAQGFEQRLRRRLLRTASTAGQDGGDGGGWRRRRCRRERFDGYSGDGGGWDDGGGDFGGGDFGGGDFGGF